MAIVKLASNTPEKEMLIPVISAFVLEKLTFGWAL